MSNLDHEFSRGTFETGPFGARFKVCFDREPPVCFDVGARGEHEIYVSRHSEGQPPDDPALMHCITTQESWAATQENLRWLRRQSPDTTRNWLREKGFEPFIDAQVTAARAEAVR